jgi:hypothetical protein
MNIPDEFSGRVCKTKIAGAITNFKKFDKIREEWSGSDIDVVYEKVEGGDPKPLIVIIFKSTEDCMAFKLKYGNEYV